MIGDRYKILGTDTIFEITGQTPHLWEFDVYSDSASGNRQSGVIMAKQSFQDSLMQKTLEKV